MKRKNKNERIIKYTNNIKYNRLYRIYFMPLILEVIFGVFGVAIGGSCYANRKK